MACSTDVATVFQVQQQQQQRTPVAEKLRIGLRLETGDGEASYSQNSEIQGSMLRETGPHLVDAIRQLSVDGSLIRVADFGCSVGANALGWADLAAVSVLQNFYAKPGEGASESPEIHYFFSDLPSNDFNSLFRELHGKDKTPYLAAAVGGSFHERLFPRGTLHIAISTNSLHWMSKIPESVQDERSPSYNRGRVWIDGGPVVVAESYASVAKQDLLDFFTHRAEELVPEGLLFAVCLCRAQPGRPDLQTQREFQKANPWGGMFEDALEDLVAQGVIQPQERDCFNIPMFHPSRDEIEDAINKTGAYNIRRLEVRQMFPDHRFLTESSLQTQHFRANPALLGVFAKNFVRAIFNPLVEAHLGSSRAQKLWERLEFNVTEHVKRTQNVFLSMRGANYALVVLSRK